MWRFLPLAPWAPRTHTFARRCVTPSPDPCAVVSHPRPQVRVARGCLRGSASCLYGAPDFAHSAASAAPSPRSVPPGPASTPSTTTASKPSAWTSCGGCSTRSSTGGRRSPHSEWLCLHVSGAARPVVRATTRLDLSGPLLEGLAGKRSVGGHLRQEQRRAAPACPAAGAGHGRDVRDAGRRRLRAGAGLREGA
jgi:hypothetical protein